jgi:hypothetical protein
MLEHVTARTFEIDKNDVGRQSTDAIEKIRRIINAHDISMACFTQTIFKDGRTQGVRVYDDDTKLGIHSPKLDLRLEISGEDKAFIACLSFQT